MYENETIVTQYKVLGVDVLIKEHQYPDSNEIAYFAFFRTNGEYHTVKLADVVGLKKKVSAIIHSIKYKESVDKTPNTM